MIKSKKKGNINPWENFKGNKAQSHTNCASISLANPHN